MPASPIAGRPATTSAGATYRIFTKLSSRGRRAAEMAAEQKREPAVPGRLRPFAQAREINIPAAPPAKSAGKMPIYDQPETPSAFVTSLHQKPRGFHRSMRTAASASVVRAQDDHVHQQM